ncbi:MULTISPECIES: erythromycin esterase family protein [unclassified Nocardia]|uniref:erythromycin esterase family protein n=1 Tax=unclassified Nocardia TaxID=2637762 RepID=UPI001CE45F20|nr:MULTISPECIES: erythromycin esterase family protein [unclassified Nocardia]
MTSPISVSGLDLSAAALADSVRAFLGALPTPPSLLALGEPTHGIEAFPELRNDLLRELVSRHGFRAIALESDCLAGMLVDDYVTTGRGDLDDVLARGFSHNFGALRANRELVCWLRDYNAGVAPADRVRFHGFDGPLEMAAAPSPRVVVHSVHAFLAEHLPASRIPHTAGELDELIGDDAEWSNPDAMWEAARSIGDTDRAKTLRCAVDDLVGCFEAEAPALRKAVSGKDFERARMFARTAHGLLRYHAAMANPVPDRISILGGLRDVMMSENLLEIVETGRPALVFAHNAHLQRNESIVRAMGETWRWWSAGALAAAHLGERYVFIAADGVDDVDTREDRSTLQGVLAAATAERALFPPRELATILAEYPDLRARSTDDTRYAPLDPSIGMDAVAFLRIPVSR